MKTTDLRTRFSLLSTLTFYDLWKTMFDDQLISDVVNQPKLSAAREQNNPAFDVTAEEIRVFLGILLVSGYNTLPEEDLYWSNQPDLGVKLVSDSICSKQFAQIKRYFYISDYENLEQDNKAAKVLPIYNALIKNLVQMRFWHDDLSIDESMVPYYGRHSIKMFIKGKPIRFRYKIWVL